MSKEEIQMAMNKTKEIVSSHPVVVFSKTYCRYCQRVKQLLTQLGASFKVFELDEISHGSEIQSALSEWTGQSTVPSVFIKGKHIGGSDIHLWLHCFCRSYGDLQARQACASPY
ncbi:glutaredoxin-C1 isoform X2 [Capsella rubella]|uniref:glutaredoxin-C1 isoform X2 n=1 Tax=Capsella rubella TaxID=81985 RepID=UPI000CD57873|nr:glutaredoxin-C1 isoform X2 [Capsella rubella]